MGGAYTVTATNGSGSTSVTFAVTGVVPFAPSRDYEPLEDKKVLVFIPDSGPRQTRTKGDNGAFPFIRNVAQKAEFDEMLAFWKAHYPGKQVYFTNPFEGVEELWWIDSGLKRKWSAVNLVSYSFMLAKR